MRRFNDERGMSSLDFIVLLMVMIGALMAVGRALGL